MGRLAGEVAFVTGAAGGIGEATALRFAEEGASIVAVDISPDPLRSLGNRLRTMQRPCVEIVCDITDEAAVADAVARAREALGPASILFNCAGGSAPDDAPITSVSMGLWERTVKVDLLGTMLCCRHVIPGMVEQRRGAVINMSSWTALRGNFHKHLYVAVKGGIISFTRALAGEYAQHGIRANAIAPGAVATARTAKRHATPDLTDPLAQKRQRLLQEYPFSAGQAIDIANIALFLASEESRMITGATLPADGGRSAY
jgi:NAD(P)-dependent dehydrogenase (short-subunit alcohol dehydrogenase family)